MGVYSGGLVERIAEVLSPPRIDAAFLFERSQAVCRQELGSTWLGRSVGFSDGAEEYFKFCMLAYLCTSSTFFSNYLSRTLRSATWACLWRCLSRSYLEREEGSFFQ